MKYTKWIFIYFSVISMIFMVVIPPFEAPDEQFHLQYINFVSKYNTLPNQYEDLTNPERHVGEGHQHPLYYIVTGFFNYFLNTDSHVRFNLIVNKKHDWKKVIEGKLPVFNHINDGVFLDREDKILFYCIRFFSILFSLLNLLFIIKIARLFFKESEYVFLTCFFVASLPQFIFISSVINNDNLANLLSTICIFLILKDSKNSNTKASYVYLGLLIGLGILTKKTLLYLVPVFLIIESIKFITNSNDRKQTIINSLITIIFILLVSSWYFIRNKLIYGDFLATQMEFETLKGLINEKSLFSIYFITPFVPSFVRSFIGALGWMNLILPLYVYVFYILIFLLSLLGFIKNGIESLKSNKKLIYSILLTLGCLVGIIYYNLTYNQSQGRFIFPVISVISVLFTIGLQKLIDSLKLSKWKNTLVLTLVLFFIIVDIITIYNIYVFYYNTSNY